MLNIIAFYFIVLFLYTALSKIVTFNSFKLDLRRDPLINFFAVPISILLPFVEIGLAALLFSNECAKLGWILTAVMMFLFTTYVALILLTIPHKNIPCSCGGIIRIMSWKNHLVFNLASLLLAFVGLDLAILHPTKMSPLK